jgi:acetyl-CoA acetyltransferase
MSQPARTAVIATAVRAAIGHPLGASGARLMNTLLAEMDARKVRYGLQTMCIGFGQATATIVERL